MLYMNTRLVDRDSRDMLSFSRWDFDPRNCEKSWFNKHNTNGLYMLTNIWKIKYMR